MSATAAVERKPRGKKAGLPNIQREPAQPPAVLSESATIMSMIATAAKDPKCDIDKMERLMAMHERMQANHAAQLYAVAMSKAQRDMPAITKSQRNEQTSSMYATLEAINEKAVPVYTECGFSLSFNTFKADEDYCVGVSCTVMHEAGHSKLFQYISPIDNKGIKGNINKTETHARASAISYGQRYLVKMIFNLNLGGEDDDGNGGAEGHRDDQRQEQKTDAYPVSDFTKNFPIWAEKIRNGNDPERTIKLIESNGRKLDEKQKAAIRNVKKGQPQ